MNIRFDRLATHTNTSTMWSILCVSSFAHICKSYANSIVATATSGVRWQCTSYSHTTPPSTIVFVHTTDRYRSSCGRRLSCHCKTDACRRGGVRAYYRCNLICGDEFGLVYVCVFMPLGEHMNAFFVRNPYTNTHTIKCAPPPIFPG